MHFTLFVGVAIHSDDSSSITCRNRRNKCRHSSFCCMILAHKPSGMLWSFFIRKFHLVESKLWWGKLKRNKTYLRRSLMAFHFRFVVLVCAEQKPWLERPTNRTALANAHGKVNDCIIFTRCTWKIMRFRWFSLRWRSLHSFFWLFFALFLQRNLLLIAHERNLSSIHKGTSTQIRAQFTPAWTKIPSSKSLSFFRWSSAAMHPELRR